jgi:hypothetical protein
LATNRWALEATPVLLLEATSQLSIERLTDQSLQLARPKLRHGLGVGGLFGFLRILRRILERRRPPCCKVIAMRRAISKP